MPTTQETLCEAHELLKAEGVRATWEYPGFINIELGGDYGIVVGDVNDDFGADLVLPDEDHEGLDWSMDPSTDAHTLAGALRTLVQDVVTMPKVAAAIKLETRMKDAVEKAQEAFWASVVESFPEAEAGDFDPTSTHVFETTCDSAVRLWVSYNVRKQEVE